MSVKNLTLALEIDFGEKIVNDQRQLERLCEWISDRTLEKDSRGKEIRRTVSVNTLKRLFGFLDENRIPRQSTLDIVAKSLGLKSYQEFESQYEYGYAGGHRITVLNEVTVHTDTQEWRLYFQQIR
jgi:hypothetical protein